MEKIIIPEDLAIKKVINIDPPEWDMCFLETWFNFENFPTYLNIHVKVIEAKKNFHALRMWFLYEDNSISTKLQISKYADSSATLWKIPLADLGVPSLDPITIAKYIVFGAWNCDIEILIDRVTLSN